MNRRDFLNRSIGLAASIAASSLLASSGVAPNRKPLRILVLGGTHYVGPALVRTAIKRGHQVSVFNRGLTRPHLFQDIERLRGNRFPERDGGLDALRNRQWDVVFDIPAYYPRLVEASATLLKNQVARYIMVSSISVYSDWTLLGMTEESPIKNPPQPGAYEEKELMEANAYYGARKVACEQVVERIYGQRWASIRATGILGAGIEDDDPNKFFWPARLALGKPILAPGDGTQTLQSIDVRDLADFMLRIAETDQMGVYNAIGPSSPFTTREYVEAARRVTGGTAPVIWSGRELGTMPMYNNNAAFSAFNPAKAQRAGLTYRTLDESVRSNWDWFRHNHPLDFDFAAKGYGLSPEEEAEGLRLARQQGLWENEQEPLG